MASTQEIWYMIGTTILKTVSETADILEVKVSTFNIDIIYCLYANLNLNYISAVSKSIFKILVPNK